VNGGGRTGADLVTALGSAWTTAGLYSDVAHREPFQAAVAKIGRYAGADLSVRSVGFVVSGEPVAGPDAAARFANALFLHGVETLGFTPDLDPSSLARLFQMVGLSPEVVADKGGLDRMVREGGLAGIRLMMRASLMGFGLDEDPAGRRGADDEAAELPLEETFFDQLEAVAARSDADERTTAVMGLVDRFTELDPAIQADLVDRLLGGVRSDLRDIFLDQLAPEDLARVVPHLDPAAFRVLGEYVSYIDGPRQEELSEAIGDPASVLKFRARVAESVRDRMEGIRLTKPASPVPEMGADPAGWFDASVEVMSGIALVEDREDRLEKLADTWKTRVSVSLAGRDDGQALAWYRSLVDLEEPPDAVIDLTGEVPDDEEIRHLVGRRETAVSAREFVDLLMDRDPSRVLGPLSEAGESGEALAGLAGDDPEALLASLDAVADPMQIVVALKQSGYRGADPRLVSLLDDPDVHGRSEVLLLVGPSLGVERLGRLLDDGDSAVRRQAAELLRRGRTEYGTNRLLERLQAEETDDDERNAIAHLLAATSDGAQRLEKLATKAGLLLSGTGRKVRSAARAALDARGSRS
jgi:hypothetical protein